jgi:hypothetical protein
MKKTRNRYKLLVENFRQIKREKDTTSKTKVSCGREDGTEMDLTKIDCHLCENVK